MKQGKVYLVGAGPGDPGLIAVRGKELLGAADVVVYDYLVDDRALNGIRDDCERIYVGKKPGKHSIGQTEIEQILVSKARDGKCVVRLKGGDPFIYGRGGEEARALAASGIEYEVVPGITAAFAAGVYAGVPLTQRDTSSSVVLLTGHEDPGKKAGSVDWRAYAKLDATLCIYMGMGRLKWIVEELLAGGLKETTPVAVIQWASLPQQKTCRAPVRDIVAKVESEELGAPAIVIIGDVATAQPNLAWFERRPLFGRRVVVTRNRPQAGELRRLLEDRGAEVLEIPLIDIKPAIDEGIWDEIMAEMWHYDWIVFTSANGVRYFMEKYFSQYEDLRSLGLIRIAAVGPSTAHAVHEYRLKVDLVPEEANAEGLARALAETGSLDSAKIVVVTGNRNRDVLVRELEEAKAIVDTLPVYETNLTDLQENSAAARFRVTGADYLIFTSSSAVESFVSQASLLQLSASARHPKACSIGPITTAALKEKGLVSSIEAPEASLESLVDALVSDALQSKTETES